LTLEQAIKKATEDLTRAGISTGRFDAELLLAHVLDRDRTWVFTHVHDSFGTENHGLFRQFVARRARREPLQYILGRQEFWGLEFTVTRDVLIPRPETELVVEAALQILRQTAQPAFIDLCTGSGCIAVSLAKESPAARIFAGDISGAAVSVARNNAGRHAVSERIRFFEGDLFQPFRELDLQARVDVITANPPYIKADDLPELQPEVRDYEPETALIAGPDGTEVHKRIIFEAPNFLKKNGALIMEMGIGQTDALINLFGATRAYNDPEVLKDLAGIDRVIAVQKK
jgi:release factor glutamine methyltransferase